MAKINKEEHEALNQVEKPTEKQMNSMKTIEGKWKRNPFTGTTKKEATQYISQSVEEKERYDFENEVMELACQTNRKRGNNMPKINQEEYEVLKELDDRWKWIARDDNYDASLFCFEDKPYKSMESGTWGPTVVQYNYLGQHDSKFQFIQWEDEEPYSISELIEEYEEHEFYDYVGWKYYESEETEVKKDIEWLKEEIPNLRGYAVIIDGKDGKWEPVTTVSMEDVYELINQLDEPEALTQEWITENSVEGDFRGVQEFWYGEFIEKEKVQNLLVPKQEELEVKIQELIEVYKQEDGAYSNLENGWISGFVEDLKSLVEEEQKYRVSLHDGTWLVSDDNKNISKATTYFMHQEDGGFMNRMHEFTEQQINDVDTRYMAFAKPVEELEE